MVRITRELVNRDEYLSSLKQELEIRKQRFFDGDSCGFPTNMDSVSSDDELLEQIKKDIPIENFTTRKDLLYIDSVVVGGDLKIVVSDIDGSNIRTISPDGCKINVEE